MFGARGKQWGHGPGTVGRSRARVRQGLQCNARGNRAKPTKARKACASDATISRCVRLLQECGRGWWVMGDWLRSFVGPQQKVQSATGCEEVGFAKVVCSFGRLSGSVWQCRNMFIGCKCGMHRISCPGDLVFCGAVVPEECVAVSPVWKGISACGAGKPSECLGAVMLTGMR